MAVDKDVFITTLAYATWYGSLLGTAHHVCALSAAKGMNVNMKIQVIGACGTGKSTLCEYISKKTGVYWIDTDKYLWKDRCFTENYSVEERFKMYNDDITNHQDYIFRFSAFLEP